MGVNWNCGKHVENYVEKFSTIKMSFPQLKFKH